MNYQLKGNVKKDSFSGLKNLVQFWSMKVAIIGTASTGYMSALRRFNTSTVIEAEAKSGVGFFKITGRISDWSEANSTAFEQKVDELIAQGIKDLEVYINTEGGSVFTANEIVNQMRRFPGKITGKGGAIVASAGSYIAVNCHSFSMARNGQMMIHKPMAWIEGNEDEADKSLKMLRNATADYKKAYADKTGMSEAEIEALWAKGDYWMNANEAKQKGFIDAIDGEEQITEETSAMLKACGCPNIPKINNSKPKTGMEIDPISIGLPANATKEQVQSKIDELKMKAGQADALTAEKQQKEANDKAEKIKSKLNKAIQDKKIKADQYARWQKLLESDFEGNSELLDGLPSVEAISGKIPGSSSENTDRSSWTYADWIDKDPEGLNKIRQDDEPKFQALMDAHYGK